LIKLEFDLCTVHPLLLGTIGSVESSQIVRLLERLGVKKLSAKKIVHHHILPIFKSGDWQVCYSLILLKEISWNKYMLLIPF